MLTRIQETKKKKKIMKKCIQLLNGKYCIVFKQSSSIKWMSVVCVRQSTQERNELLVESIYSTFHQKIFYILVNVYRKLEATNGNQQVNRFMHLFCYQQFLWCNIINKFNDHINSSSIILFLDLCCLIQMCYMHNGGNRNRWTRQIFPASLSFIAISYLRSNHRSKRMNEHE